MRCFVKTRGHSLRVGSLPRLKCLEGEGGFKVIMVRHGYPCQARSEVKASLVTAGMSRDGAPHLLAPCVASLEVQRDLFSFFFINAITRIVQAIWY